MKTKKYSISTLSEDIQKIIAEKHGKSFDLLRLCKDNSNRIELFDKKPVLDIFQDDLVGIFSSGSNRYFLQPEQVFRLSVFFNLPMHGIIGLLLKSEWEILFAEIIRVTYNDSSELNSHFKNIKLIETFISEFSPDKGNIINLFVNLEREQKTDYQIDKIDFFIHDLLNDHNFLNEYKWINNHFHQNNRTENLLLLNCTEPEKQKYLELKELWKYKTEEFSEFLLLLERKKRIYTNLENRYLKIFGNAELKKLRLVNQVGKYTAVLKIMKKYPELSYRELIKMVNNVLIESEKEKSELKNKIRRSNTIFDLSVFPGTTSLVTDEFKRSYLSETKKLLRKIYMTLHPDSLTSYSNLTDKKKEQLNELWMKLMKTTNAELYSFSPSMLLYQYPDLDVLKDIYFKACIILGITPDNVESGDRLEFMINKGTPMNKIIGFLSEEIENIELHLAHLELVQNEYSHESESEYCRIALENISGHYEKLKDEMVELKKEVTRLKKEISGKLLKREYEQ